MNARDGRRICPSALRVLPYVVLQEDRPDGMDLVTLRYGLVRQGALQAYAGAVSTMRSSMSTKLLPGRQL